MEQTLEQLIEAEKEGRKKNLIQNADRLKRKIARIKSHNQFIAVLERVSTEVPNEEN